MKEGSRSFQFSLSAASFVVFFLFILHVSFSYGKEVRGVTKETIKIGSITDHTGPTSSIGVLVVLAYKNFIKSVNERGGIHGRKIKIIMEDDRYSIPAGIAAFKKLVFKDQVLAILGPVSVGETKVLFRHIEKHKIPTLPWAPDRSLVEPYKRYVFPTNGFYDNDFGVIFEYIIKELKPNPLKIALCYPDVESGKVARRSAEEWAKFFGVSLHLEVTPSALVDVTSNVIKMKRAGITHVLIHSTAPGTVFLLKDMKKLGFSVPVFGTSATCTEDIITIGGKTSKIYVGASPYSSWYEDSPGMAQLRKISMKYNPGAKESYRIKSYILGWVIPEILFEGVKRAGEDLSGETLVAALETINDFDTKGLCGPITYTNTMHYGLNYNKLFRADPPTGKLIPITDWRRAPSKK